MDPKVEKAENELFDLVVKFAFFYITDTVYSDGSVRATPVCLYVRNEFEIDKISFRDKRHWSVLEMLCEELDYLEYIKEGNNKIKLVSKVEGSVEDIVRTAYERISHWYGQELSFEHDYDGNLVDIIPIGLLNYKDALLIEYINKIKKEIANRKSNDVGGLVLRMQKAYNLRHDIARIIDEITNKNNIMDKNNVMDKNNDEPVAMVFKTKDYDKFKLISENREPDHVNALVSSFRKRLVPNAILCNEKLEIIDGQNRFLALKELGEPILYYCIDGLDIYDVASLNSYGKNWSNEDYVRMWAALGKNEYKKILDFCREFPDFSLANALTILSNNKRVKYESRISLDGSKKVNTIRNSANSTSPLKAGSYTIEDIEHSRYVARCILEYKAFACPGKQIYIQSAFVSAMVMLLKNKNFDNNEMVKKITMFPSLFHRCLNNKEYISMLEEIWNYRRQKKIRFEY